MAATSNGFQRPQQVDQHNEERQISTEPIDTQWCIVTPGADEHTERPGKVAGEPGDEQDNDFFCQPATKLFNSNSYYVQHTGDIHEQNGNEHEIPPTVSRI